MKLEELNQIERESLFPLRAEIWQGPLSQVEFSNRNKRLYQHPYGQKHIATYALKKDNTIVASMDIMDVKLILKNRDKINTADSYLLACFIVPKELRGKGYSKELVSQFLATKGQGNGVLFSDIGPEYYAKLGFTQRKIFVVEGPQNQSNNLKVTPISLEDFVSSLQSIKEKELNSHPEGATCLKPDTEFFDWQIERFKYFSEIKNKDFPKNVAFKVKHQTEEHILLSVPNFSKNRQEGLWVTSGCVLCEEVLANQAHENGLESYAYWDVLPPMHVKEKECPMVKTEQANTLFLDPQLIDWW